MSGFEDIFDQSHAISVLTRALSADRLPHGLLFTGPVGVGKAMTAAALAKVFLCEQPTGERACNRCDSCRVFDAGNHPDYHVITRELIRYHDKTGKSKGIDLSINVLRPELIDPAGRKAGMNRGKVFIIEQAESMNAQAQNAILKTLEEPAGRTIIILLTDQPGALLATVRSRCQAIRFNALPVDRVAGELEKRGHPPAIARSAALLSDGSLGEAIHWLEDGVIAASLELTVQLNAIANGAPGADLGDWFKKSADAYAEKQLARDELGSKDQAVRQANALYLRLAASHFREKLASVNDETAMELSCNAIDAIVRAEMLLDGNVNVALVFQELGIALERSRGAGVLTVS